MPMALQIMEKKTPPIHATYELGRRLGKGSFGVVYECRNKHTGFTYACKTIDKHRLEDEADVEDVRREIGVLRLLAGHASIVELQDVFEDDDKVYIVMELCEGGDLFDDIKTNGPLPEKHARAVFRELVSAVAYCHLNSIMHRDIKPENVLFLRAPTHSNPDDSLMCLSQMPSSTALASNASNTTTTFQGFHSSSSSSSSSSNSSFSASRPSGVKLADFGLALILAQGDTAVGLTGSRYYTAPEMVRGKRYGRRADVWSLGVVLCTLLTGRLPFAGKTHEDDEGLKRSILKGTVNFEASVWRPISALAKDLVRQMLTTDPRKRPKAKHLLDHPWLKDALPTACDSNAGGPLPLLEPIGVVPASMPSPARLQAEIAKISAQARSSYMQQKQGSKKNRLSITSQWAATGSLASQQGESQPQPHQHQQQQQQQQPQQQQPQQQQPAPQHRDSSSSQYLRQMLWPNKQAGDATPAPAVPAGAAPGSMVPSGAARSIAIPPVVVAPPVGARGGAPKASGEGGWAPLGSPTTPYEGLECPSPEPMVSPGDAAASPERVEPLPMPSPTQFQTPVPLALQNSSNAGSARVCKRALFTGGGGVPGTPLASDEAMRVKLCAAAAVAHANNFSTGKQPLRQDQNQPQPLNPQPQTSFAAFERGSSSRGFSSAKRLPDSYSRRSLFSFSPLRRNILQGAFGDGGRSKQEKAEAQLLRLQQRKQRQQQQMMMSAGRGAEPVQLSGSVKAAEGASSSFRNHKYLVRPSTPINDRAMRSPLAEIRLPAPEARPPTADGTRAPMLYRRAPSSDRRPSTPTERWGRSPTPDKLRFMAGMRSRDPAAVSLNAAAAPSFDAGRGAQPKGPLRGLLSPRVSKEGHPGGGKGGPAPATYVNTSYVVTCTGVKERRRVMRHE